MTAFASVLHLVNEGSLTLKVVAHGSLRCRRSRTVMIKTPKLKLNRKSKWQSCLALLSPASEKHSSRQGGTFIKHNDKCTLFSPYCNQNMSHNGRFCNRGVGVLQTTHRNFSFETYNKYFSPDVAPIGFAQKLLESIHTATGLPWWASIALSTVALRGLVALPLAVYSMRVTAKVELLQPEIMKLSQELRKEAAVAVKKFAWDAKYTRFKYNSTMKKLIRDLYIRDNCHPAKSSLILWFQIPLWVCMSFALRNMSGAVPASSDGTVSPVLCQDLQTEGLLWFQDLTVPDSTWVLPLLLGATNLLNIEMSSLTAKQVTKFHKGVTFVMRLMSILMVPVGAVVPSCMCYYWVCSSLVGLGQNVLFKMPSVRRLLRIPQTPSESRTPFQDLISAAKMKYFVRLKGKGPQT